MFDLATVTGVGPGTEGVPNAVNGTPLASRIVVDEWPRPEAVPGIPAVQHGGGRPGGHGTSVARAGSDGE